jgi:hypothetical protein
MLTEEGTRRAKAIGESFDALFDRMVELTLDGDPRCIAVMRSNLEVACFYARKAVATAPVNQEDLPL